MKDHSREPKAFSKSIKSNKPGMFLSVACDTDESDIFTYKSVFQKSSLIMVDLRFGSTSLIRLAIDFAAIL